jgi:hypothetical protein
MITKHKVFAVAISLLMLTSPAFAQQFQSTAAPSKDDKGKKSDQRPGEPEPLYVDEKAYNSAVDRIPDKGMKYDPWGNVREKPAAPEKPAARK